MIMLFNKILFLTTKYVAYIGMLFLLAAVLITTTDVVMRKVDGQGVYGAIDLIQLMVLSAAYLSIPYTFMTRAHVAVSMITDRLSRRGQAMTQVLAMVLACLFMCAIAYYGYLCALEQAEYGDVSMIFGLPMIYYWLPLIVGSALSTVVTLHIAVESLYVVITGHSGHFTVEE
ncbi:TRAP transporter small permease [Terasakiella sp. A23]|uniref:TRAP transporter small permease n=1 Tax=Terasakiella sp. FCG-A23 TaxID=3080561 RepID=UPI002953E1F6|nr:TRAP transporter small permease [Terasakiella sp. A23]MDV7340593.1 TRAP transporter small permease [Terasakiella sp. A23]